MIRLLQCMPTVLEIFIDEELHWYETMCSNKFHFFNLFVDVLHELNKLNIKFQNDMVTSQLLVQPSISLFQFYHYNFNPRMDLCLIIQARLWENS
jgi:hypothetical protein